MSRSASGTAGLSDERRRMLAHKGRLLYGKYCGMRGEGICAENFALYHAKRGELAAVRDFLSFLRQVVAELRVHDPQGRLPMTLRLVGRVERLLESEGDDAE